MRLMLIAVITCLPLPVIAQSMTGRVTDLATGKPLFPVIVVNEATRQVTATTDNGAYSIPARKGDIIAFSYIGYVTREATRSDAPTDTLLVLLEPTDYELQEFRITPGTLTQYQKDSIERSEIYHIPLERTHPNPFMSPVSAIAEKFSHRAKTIYQFQKRFEAGEIEKYIDTKYYPELVTQLTGLTGDSIGHFMYACPMPLDFARTATDLEIKMWIRSSFREWQAK